MNESATSILFIFNSAYCLLKDGEGDTVGTAKLSLRTAQISLV